MNGIIINLGTAQTSWKSKLKNEAMWSSLEAEYQYVTEAAKEVMWYHNIFNEMQMIITKSILVMVDNLNSIKVIKDHVFQGRTNYIEKSCHLI